MTKKSRLGAVMHDPKTANLMKIFANILENISEDQLNELVQASLQPAAEKEPPAQPPSHEHVYDERWVVIQNQLLHAISRLSLNERRLIMHLSPIVRLAVNKNPKQRRFFVSALDFAKAFGIEQKNAYREIEKVATKMHEKPFYIWDFDKDGVHSKHKRGVSWFVECGYLDSRGGIEVILGERVTEMLTVFDKEHAFTKHQKEWIMQLGGYGIALFQILWSYIYLKDIEDASGQPIVGVKEKEFTLKYLREKFDCVDRYEKSPDFRKWVLDAAIKDIHEHTPLKIKYENVKKGRSIVGFKFTFWDTSNQKSVEQKGLSDKQIDRLKVSYRAKAFGEYNSHLVPSNFTSTSYSDLIERWRPRLKDPAKLAKFVKVKECLELEK